jgi:hypothetical protein
MEMEMEMEMETEGRRREREGRKRILMGPSSVPYKLHPPTHKSLVGQIMPQVSPRGLSDKIALAAP